MFFACTHFLNTHDPKRLRGQIDQACMKRPGRMRKQDRVRDTNQGRRSLGNARPLHIPIPIIPTPQNHREF